MFGIIYIAVLQNLLLFIFAVPSSTSMSLHLDRANLILTESFNSAQGYISISPLFAHSYYSYSITSLLHFAKSEIHVHLRLA